MPGKGQRAAAKAKRRNAGDTRTPADKAFAKDRIDYDELRARILSDLAIPGGPSEKY